MKKSHLKLCKLLSSFIRYCLGFGESEVAGGEDVREFERGVLIQ